MLNNSNVSEIKLVKIVNILKKSPKLLFITDIVKIIIFCRL